MNETVTGEPREIQINHSNGWQVCPKCQGQGLVWFPPNWPWNETITTDGTSFECDVCKGKKIISIDFGLPPL